jgi:hypothetical protein
MPGERNGRAGGLDSLGGLDPTWGLAEYRPTRQARMLMEVTKLIWGEGKGTTSSRHITGGERHSRAQQQCARRDGRHRLHGL